MDKILMEEKETYQNTMETRLGRLGARIDELQFKAEKMKGKAKIEITQVIDDLRLKLSSIRQNFLEMKLASGEIWKDMKSGLEKSTSDLKEMVDKIGPKIKEFPHLQPTAKYLGLFLGGVISGYFIGRFIHKTDH